MNTSISIEVFKEKGIIIWIDGTISNFVLKPQSVNNCGKYNVNEQHAKIRNVKERPLNLFVYLTAMDNAKNAPKRAIPEIGSFPLPDIKITISQIVRKRAATRYILFFDVFSIYTPYISTSRYIWDIYGGFYYKESTKPRILYENLLYVLL